MKHKLAERMLFLLNTGISPDITKRAVTALGAEQ
jgi:hypothetical protein